MLKNIFNPFFFNLGGNGMQSGMHVGVGILGIVFTIIVILLIAFWIWMLVHAIVHDIEDKPVWILVLWIMNIVGAIVYYFAVKRKCDCIHCVKGSSGNPTIFGEIEEIEIEEK